MEGRLEEKGLWNTEELGAGTGNTAMGALLQIWEYWMWKNRRKREDL